MEKWHLLFFKSFIISVGGKKKISGEHILICREEVSTALVLSLVRLHGSMVDGAIRIIIDKNDDTHGQ